MRITVVSSVDGSVRDRAVERLTSAWAAGRDDGLCGLGAVLGWDVLEGGTVISVAHRVGQPSRRRTVLMEHECWRCVARLVIVPDVLAQLEQGVGEAVLSLPAGLDSATVLAELFTRLEDAAAEAGGAAGPAGLGPHSVEVATVCGPVRRPDGGW